MFPFLFIFFLYKWIDSELLLTQVPSKPSYTRLDWASCHPKGTGVKPVLPVRLKGSQIPPLV